MERLLSDALSPAHLEVIDESQKHHGHAGARPEGETHYRIRIASAMLGGLTRVQQHQKIYAALKDLFPQGLHALAIEVLPLSQ